MGNTRPSIFPRRHSLVNSVLECKNSLSERINFFTYLSRVSSAQLTRRTELTVSCDCQATTLGHTTMLSLSRYKENTIRHLTRKT